MEIRNSIKGIIKENFLLRLIIGLCPSLAVATNVISAIWISSATAFVLIASNIVVSVLRKIIPNEVKIPVFIVIITTFVTIAGYITKAFSPDLQLSFGILIPIIFVNCIILGREEDFAYNNKVIPSIIDAVLISIGFTLLLVSIGAIREILGCGSFWGIQIFSPSIAPATMILPTGAFLIIGILMAILNKVENKVQ